MPVYKANDKYNATLTSGYTVGQSTLYTSSVPDNVPTIVVLAKGTDNETVFSVTEKTVNSLTGVARLRGASVNLDTSTPLTCLNNEEFINQYSSALFSGEGLTDFIFGIDGGSTDAYAIALTVAPTSYDDIIGVPILFLANTVNTGEATINVNSLGVKTIKKLYNQTLNDGDIKAGEIVLISYDGTNFQLMTLPSITKATGAEVTTGTDDAKYVTAKAMADAGVKLTKTVVIQVLSGTTALAVGDGKAYFTVPEELNGMNLTGVHARVIVAGTTNTTDIQIRNVTDSVDMLSTKLTIDSTETGSNTAVAPAVIDATKDDVVTNDLIAIDIDAISTTAPTGLVVRLRFSLP